MNRRELIKELRSLAKSRGVIFRFDEQQGKGSHGTLYFGEKKTTCPKGELKQGLVKAIKKQLETE
tara:strand:- start:781 stop:975 length:195 start_codon:yes stop_codon:yes gene_type:complete